MKMEFTVQPSISPPQKNKCAGILVLTLICFFISNPAFAGGLAKVDSFIQNILSVLEGTSIVVVTIAIMWAGYKFLFKQADMAECAKILAGGLLVGGAAELAKYLLG